MFRSCQIIIRELCSLLKFYYSIRNSILVCKRGVLAAYHVVLGMCCRECSWLGVRCMLSLRSIRRTPSQLHSPQHIPTQHDMLPQHLVCKYELNEALMCRVTDGWTDTQAVDVLLPHSAPKLFKTYIKHSGCLI